MKLFLSLFKKIFLLKYLVLGFAVAFIIHITVSCLKDEDEPDKPGNEVEIEDIKAGAKAMESAFLSGDPNAIKSILTDNALELYGSDLSKINKNHLIKLGEALKSRNLKVNTDIYAEYNYTKDGIVHTFALAKQEDESWKLMRF
jgi:hypothetical protein